MTDDECIAMAMLHADEPFWEHKTKDRFACHTKSAWYVRDRKDVHHGYPMHGYFCFNTRAQAARAYCKWHGLLQEVNDENDNDL